MDYVAEKVELHGRGKRITMNRYRMQRGISGLFSAESSDFGIDN